MKADELLQIQILSHQRRIRLFQFSLVPHQRLELLSEKVNLWGVCPLELGAAHDYFTRCRLYIPRMPQPSLKETLPETPIPSPNIPTCKVDFKIKLGYDIARNRPYGQLRENNWTLDTGKRMMQQFIQFIPS